MWLVWGRGTTIWMRPVCPRVSATNASLSIAQIDHPGWPGRCAGGVAYHFSIAALCSGRSASGKRARKLLWHALRELR